MGGLLLKGVGELEDLGAEAAPAGFQDPPIRVGEAGEIHVHEGVEGAFGLREPGLEVPRRGSQGRYGGVARRGRGAARIAQQRLAGDGVVRGGAPGGQEGLGLAGAQAVAFQGRGQPRLVAARQRRQGVGRGGR
ncbi:MAG TPA: hypothetical protein VMT79_05995 [Candidatus Binatia bacterium]|nr:hypothetical protein [Candidatus Binatia bacterium]